MVAVDQILRNSKSYWKVDTVPLLSWLKLIQKPKCKTDAATQWQKQSRISTTNQKVKVNFCLPEFIAKKY